MDLFDLLTCLKTKFSKIFFQHQKDFFLLFFDFNILVLSKGFKIHFDFILNCLSISFFKYNEFTIISSGYLKKNIKYKFF